MLGSTPAWAWWTFGGAFGALLALDLLSHRGRHGQSHRAAVVWAMVWVVAGLVFVAVPWVAMGDDVASNYVAAYFIEKSLSLDNLFVFLVVFQSLKIPLRHQRTALSWGIFGALVFRGIFIVLGAAAIQRWDAVKFVFAALLVFAAWRTFREDPGTGGQNRIVGWLARHLPVTETVHGKKFFAKEDGRRVATPLLISVIALELTDIMFAIDSVPAAFAVADSTFVIYSSNAFAILGLRSLYIVLAEYLQRLVYLHYGLAVILGFAAVKIAISEWVHVPASISVGIIAAIVAVSIAASLLLDNRDDE